MKPSKPLTYALLASLALALALLFPACSTKNADVKNPAIIEEVDEPREESRNEVESVPPAVTAKDFATPPSEKKAPRPVMEAARPAPPRQQDVGHRYETPQPTPLPSPAADEGGAMKEAEVRALPPRGKPKGEVSRAPAAAPLASPPQGTPRVASAEPVKRKNIAPPTDRNRQSYEGFGEVFDEVWVIQKPDQPLGTTGEAMPGGGELRALLPDPDRRGVAKEIPLPLKHTEVAARVEGYVASVTVSQEYQNPYDTKIEAVYVFPLPQNAAVSDFVMRIGERTIRGIIREREEARRLYEEARNQGYSAALLQQERPNIFTQKVANIEPGREIGVDIRYFNTLAYDKGEYEFVFPMVVGPRYNPPGFKGGIGAAPRGAKSGQPAQVSYLAPGERSGHDIGLTLTIDAGVAIEAIASDTHAIDVRRSGKSTATISLKAADSIPNKDFVLRYRVAGDRVKSALLTEENERGGFFSLILQPPREIAVVERSPKEMIFVLDCSGSMNGWPMEISKRAMTRALKNLGRDDTFQVIRFSNNASALGPDPVPATPENIERGLRYIETLRGSGGTQMIEGIKAALDFPHDPRRLRIVSFLTDGYIGNEAEILGAIDEKLGAARVFSFGVGSSVNRYLMENMARVGRGAVAYITTDASPVEPVDRFYEVIGHPALTDIAVDWKGMKVSGLYPARIPDLFVDRPVIVTGRFEGKLPDEIVVRGRVAGKEIAFTVHLSEEARRAQEGVSKIWARAKIADLMNEMATEGHTQAREDELRETALAYNLVSSYTSFVAVDATRRTRGEYGVTVEVPVPMLEGVRYETTIRR